VNIENCLGLMIVGDEEHLRDITDN